MPSIVNFVPITISKTENLTVILLAKISYGIFNGLLNKVSLILTIVCEDFSCEKAQLRSKAVRQQIRHRPVQREASNAGTMSIQVCCRFTRRNKVHRFAYCWR